MIWWPMTRIDDIYREHSGLTKTKQAETQVSAADVVSGFRETVAELQAFPGAGRFHDGKRTALRALAERESSGKGSTIDNTEDFQAWLGLPRWRVTNDKRLDFHYVDRELIADRIETAGGPAYATGQKVKLDALLVNANEGDRTPIIGEIKVASDQNARYALLQALAAAALLMPESQRQRFRAAYPEHFADDVPKRLDVYVLTHRPQMTGKPGLLHTMALDLCEELRTQAELGQWIRRIAVLDGTLSGTALSFECLTLIEY